MRDVGDALDEMNRLDNEAQDHAAASSALARASLKPCHVAYHPSMVTPPLSLGSTKGASVVVDVKVGYPSIWPDIYQQERLTNETCGLTRYTCQCGRVLYDIAKSTH